jgi:hypothetical protein
MTLHQYVSKYDRQNLPHSKNFLKDSRLTNASLGDNPGQAEEKHHTPYIEKVAYQDTFYPPKLDYTLTVCWNTHRGICWLKQKSAFLRHVVHFNAVSLTVFN